MHSLDKALEAVSAFDSQLWTVDEQYYAIMAFSEGDYDEFEEQHRDFVGATLGFSNRAVQALSSMKDKLDSYNNSANTPHRHLLLKGLHEQLDTARGNIEACNSNMSMYKQVFDDTWSGFLGNYDEEENAELGSAINKLVDSNDELQSCFKDFSTEVNTLLDDLGSTE